MQTILCSSIKKILHTTCSFSKQVRPSVKHINLSRWIALVQTKNSFFPQTVRSDLPSDLSKCLFHIHVYTSLVWTKKNSLTSNQMLRSPLSSYPTLARMHLRLGICALLHSNSCKFFTKMLWFTPLPSFFTSLSFEIPLPHVFVFVSHLFMLMNIFYTKRNIYSFAYHILSFFRLSSFSYASSSLAF